MPYEFSVLPGDNLLVTRASGKLLPEEVIAGIKKLARQDDVRLSMDRLMIFDPETDIIEIEKQE